MRARLSHAISQSRDFDKEKADTLKLIQAIAASHGKAISIENLNTAYDSFHQKLTAHCTLPDLSFTESDILTFFRDFTTTLYQDSINNQLRGNSVFDFEKHRSEQMSKMYTTLKPHIKKFGDLNAGEKSCLWSDMNVGLPMAMVEHTPLNKLPLGSAFEKFLVEQSDPLKLTWDNSYPLWGVLSKIYIENSKQEEIPVFLPESIRVGSIFWDVELNTIQNNMDDHVKERIVIYTLKADALERVKTISETASSSEEAQTKINSIVRDKANWRAKRPLKECMLRTASGHIKVQAIRRICITAAGLLQARRRLKQKSIASTGKPEASSR